MSNDKTDFNDLHESEGLDVVKQQINNVLGIGENPAQRQLLEGENSDQADQQAAPHNDQWKTELILTRDMQVKPIAGNVELILRHDERWQNVLAYCDFSYRVIKHHSPMPDMRTGEWEDADTARVRVWFAHTYKISPSRADVLDAIIVVAQKQRFHPVREYLSTLAWDEKPRLHELMNKAMSAEGVDDYLRLVGRKFLIGAVARVMRPGCKMDNVLILEGEQGKGKSTIVRTLFGDWYSDAPLPLGDKDAYQNIQGVWGAELAELDSFNKAESTTAKMFFSQVRDRYRPSYGHSAQDFPRQCVFIGTTNQEEYLKDYTGNRRYWPVKCFEIDVGWVNENRDQIWAEALQAFLDGEQWWPDETEQIYFTKEQEDRLQIDPWQYRIERFLQHLNKEYVTADEVLLKACDKDTGTHNRADQNRIAPLMKMLGWHKARKLILDDTGSKRQRHVYCRPDGWEFVKNPEDLPPIMPGEDEKAA